VGLAGKSASSKDAIHEKLSLVMVQKATGTIPSRKIHRCIAMHFAMITVIAQQSFVQTHGVV
jgi:hypothetical protein